MRKNKLCSSGIGGQAVMEGVMMRNKEHYAVAVRKPDQTIDVETDEYHSFMGKSKILSFPFIRGIFAFIDSLILGIKTLTMSASFLEDDDIEEEPDKFEQWLIGKFGDRAERIIMGFTVVLSVVIAIALFMILPLFIADVMEKHISWVGTNQVPVIEGIVKIVLFVAYLLLISLMNDIKRTFMYHGAEHKCINCIEHGLPLTVDNVRISSRLHKRCGTSFLFFVLAISIILLMLIQVESPLMRVIVRIALIPVIAGISYEVLKLAGRSENPIINLLSRPGLAIQKLTTKEPDDSMIEVAIQAVEAVFDWRDYERKNF